MFIGLLKIINFSESNQKMVEITEEALKALLCKAAKYDALMNTDIPTIFFSHKGRCIDANPAYLQLVNKPDLKAIFLCH
jgi:hypothetical protein